MRRQGRNFLVGATKDSGIAALEPDYALARLCGLYEEVADRRLVARVPA